jgi:hypothetical protein
MLKEPFYLDQQLRWNLHDVYDMLGLTVHHGRRWQWSHRHMPLWVKFLKQLYPGDTSAMSMGLRSDLPLVGEPFLKLDFPSCSSAGLLAVAFRWWASSAPQAGRLTNKKAVQAAKEFCEALVKVMAHNSFHLNILVGSESCVRWPRPWRGSGAKKVIVDRGVVVLDSVKWGDDDARKDGMCFYFGHMMERLGPRVDLMQFMSELVRWRPKHRVELRGVLLGQVVATLSQQLEQRCLEALRGRAFEGNCLQVEKHVFRSKGASAEALARELTRYLLVVHEHYLVKPKMVSMASDKSRVKGSSLLSSFVATSDNVANWCFPVVAAPA